MTKLELIVELGNANYNIKLTDDIILELSSYLNSDKFNCNNELDGYVNIKDIFNYLNRIRQIG